MMGGEMGISSTPGQGSTFWFSAVFAKQATAGEPEPQLSASLKQLRALIVDDNATNRKILANQLESWGIEHVDAESGAQALQLLQAAAGQGKAYDLALLDLMMPEMDGYELARKIKADSRTAPLALILLTSGGAPTTDYELCRIAATLTKPVRQSQLFECLMNVVSVSAAAAVKAEPLKLITTPRPEVDERLSSHLILLAEDNIVNQKVAVRQLRQLGYRADAVANGREALEALSRIPYDLVLMDCQMPEMDGYEATAAIRQREGAYKHTPIVAMTAHALAGDREKSIAAGMDDHISKPVRSYELARVLDQYLPKVADNIIAREAGEVTQGVSLHS
jgi:CheY-like chemotaxis protein